MTKNLKGKRSRGDGDAQNECPSKRSRRDSRLEVLSTAAASKAKEKVHHNKTAPVLRPYPYFYYKDYSQVPDPDSFKPLTGPGRVPNFPAKMMAILSRPELSDIVTWLDHGRGWKVLKPRELEAKVLPTYFEHSKFSSFIRQANGWGFRRLTQGRDRNSYYNELFLRGLPHLCKDMKRHGVSEKQAADPGHEPDFYKISQQHPVAERGPYDDSILLPHILKDGPKARMPIYFRCSPSSSRLVSRNPAKATISIPESIHQFQTIHSGATPLLYTKMVTPNFQPLNVPKKPIDDLYFVNNVNMNHFTMMQNLAAFEASAAASQFAAGFAAATVLNHKHYRNISGHAFGSFPSAVPR